MTTLPLLTLITFLILQSCLPVMTRGPSSEEVPRTCPSIVRILLSRSNPASLQFHSLQIPKGVTIFKMLKHFDGEDYGRPRMFYTNVEYLTRKERVQYEVFFNQEGKIVNKEGTFIIGAEDRQAIYVISPEGKMYLSFNHHQGFFHHSSFLAGEDVIAAGMIEVKKGAIQMISNSSGHYYPSNQSFSLIIQLLREQGIKIENVGYAGTDNIFKK